MHRLRLSVLVALLATACSGGDTPRTAGTTAASGAPPSPVRQVYVAVGASDGVGVGADDPGRDAWPEVLARTALPPGTELVNLGIPGATVATALEHELPEALRHEPALATVWLNVNDLVAGVPVAAYERQLARLVTELRRNGRTRVLVANTPPLDRLPVYVDCEARPGCLGGNLPSPESVRAAVASYNAAVARVVDAAGAELVDLHAAGSAAADAGVERALLSGDGFHPSTAGYRAVADAFAAVLGSR